MREAVRSPITTWLARWRAGQHDALERIVPLLYQELRQVARRQLGREPQGHTLSATALVHEVYLRLLRQRQIQAADREALLAVAAQTMRRVLVDHARRRRRLKRGGDESAVLIDDLDAVPLLSEREVDEVIAFDEVSERLANLDPRAARIVEHRVFAGLTLEETADALGCSAKTVQRTWTAARAWLRKEIPPHRSG